jgi:hypothetical protein
LPASPAAAFDIGPETGPGLVATAAEDTVVSPGLVAVGFGADVVGEVADTVAWDYPLLHLLAAAVAVIEAGRHAGEGWSWL